MATLAGNGSGRPSPAIGEDSTLSRAERRHVAGLMRVNHSGEVCAQALYWGQSLMAREETVREKLLAAAKEEQDHLAWCAERLGELSARPSLLNFIWFSGSLITGIVISARGDAWSMAFIEETERQVVKHLERHLERLPVHDERSRAILAVMRTDEARHGAEARRAGAATLPSTLPILMAAQSRVMTTLSYWL